MRLGIFGGSFDPVHLGHLLLAESCREQCRLDAVWFLPSAVAPHKQERVATSGDQRVEMLELAIAGNSAFSVCRHEVDRGGVNYTVETLEHLHAEHPGWEMFLLMGQDMLADLPNWRNPGRICELALPVVVRRPGCEPLDFDSLRDIAGTERFRLMREHQVEMPQVALSSTEFRCRSEAGKSIRYWTPRAVEKYIEAHGLYAENSS